MEEQHPGLAVAEVGELGGGAGSGALEGARLILTEGFLFARHLSYLELVSSAGSHEVGDIHPTWQIGN